jgi:Zn-dependent metalloprotease
MFKKMCIGLSILGVMALSGSAFAAKRVVLRPQAPSISGFAGGVAQPVLSLNQTSPDQAVLDYDAQQYTVKQVSEKKDNRGKTHKRYVQTYLGVPVWGRQILAHADTATALDKQAPRYSGYLTTGLSADLDDVKPLDGFTAAEALAFSKKQFVQDNHHLEDQTLVYENEQTELVIYPVADGQKAVLAYSVSFFVDTETGGQPARPHYLINAKTKAPIKHWDALMHRRAGRGPGGNDKIGRYEYGRDRPKFEVRVTPRGECFMASPEVRTVDMKYGYYGSKTHHFGCYRQDGDGINGAASPLNDAHYFGEQVVEMYRNWYEMDPLSFKLVMRVHYGYYYENAFWNGSSMTFGDGGWYFYPLVALDVAGHEVSHGVTEQNSNLEYYAQSGGMNEAFSDMAGKALESYVRGYNTWSIGDDITKGSRPLRYMDVPEEDGRSIGDARDYSDDLDVHYTSGVYNKAFYLLATSDDWNTQQAFEVFLHANRFYWVQTSDYIDGAYDVVTSAEDLGYDQQAVMDAFKGVGISCTIDACELMPDDQI